MSSRGIKMKKRIITSLILLAIPTLSQSAQKKTGRDSTPGKKITFEEYLSSVGKKLPDLRSNEIALSRARIQKYRTKAVDDTYLTGDAAWSRVKQYSLGSSFQMDYARGVTSSVGVNRTISATGTRLSTSLGYTWNDIKGTNTLAVPSQSLSIPVYSPVLTVSVSQPLLKNFFGKIDRYAKKNAGLQIRIETARKEVNDRNVLNYFKKLYIQWIQYNETLDLLQKTIDNTRRLEAQVRRKARRGLADNDDVQKIRTSLLSYQAQFYQYRQRRDSITREIALYVNTDGIVPDRASRDGLFILAGKKEYVPTAFEKTGTGRMLVTSLEQLSLQLGVNRNDLLPNLDLYASVSQKSNEGSFSSSFSKMNDTDYSIGLSVSYPLGNHEKRGALRDTKLAIKEMKASHESTRNEYMKKIIQIQESVRAVNKLIAVHRGTVTALNSQYITEYKKYNQARLNLTFLIQTRNSIAAEEVALLDLQGQLIGYYFDYCDLVQ